MTEPTETFLCSMAENKYVIFVRFKIEDLTTKTKYFEVIRPESIPLDFNEWQDPKSHNDEYRIIKYDLPKELLKAKQISTT